MNPEGIQTAKGLYINKGVKDETESWFVKNGKYGFNVAISDIIGAVTENDIRPLITHDVECWNTYTKLLEIFANVSSMYVLQDVALIDLKMYFRDIYAFLEMIENRCG